MTLETERRLPDGSIDFNHYRAEAQRLRNEQRRDAWLWLSGVTRNVVNACRRAIAIDRAIDIVTTLR